MRLLSRPAPQRVDPVDEMYHCCRWCHNFSEGKCWRKDIYFNEGDSEIMYAADMGEFSEVIEETMTSPNAPYDTFINGMKSLLSDWKISDKRTEKFKQEFEEGYSQYVLEMKEALDEAILKKVNNIIDKTNHEFQGVEIESPSEFYCRYWE